MMGTTTTTNNGKRFRIMVWRADGGEFPKNCLRLESDALWFAVGQVRKRCFRVPGNEAVAQELRTHVVEDLREEGFGDFEVRILWPEISNKEFGVARVVAF